MEIKNFSDVRSFLFDNTSIRQTIFKNTFWLAVAGGISKLLKFVLFVYVARILGATEYGKFTFALAFIGLFIIFADLGLSQIITREFAREKEKEKEFSAIVSLKILLSLGTFVLVLLGSFLVVARVFSRIVNFPWCAASVVVCSLSIQASHRPHLD